MTWSINGSGSSKPDDLDTIKEIWNEAAKKVHEVSRDSFSVTYNDDHGAVSIGNFPPVPTHDHEPNE